MFDILSTSMTNTLLRSPKYLCPKNERAVSRIANELRGEGHRTDETPMLHWDRASLKRSNLVMRGVDQFSSGPRHVLSWNAVLGN